MKRTNDITLQETCIQNSVALRDTVKNFSHYQDIPSTTSEAPNQNYLKLNHLAPRGSTMAGSLKRKNVVFDLHALTHNREKA